MRVARLDLARYGCFTDQVVELPAHARDFHIVVGPNEAGKSTTRAALSDVLFGVTGNSRYTFLHDNKSMRIGAVLEHGDQRLTFRRRKGIKSTLLDENEGALPDAVLAPFLGSTDRTLFERMFSLDHAGLVNGGRQLLDAKDDIGRMLFQASGGLARFGEVCENLKSQADELWAPRRGADRRYYAALDLLNLADGALRDTIVRAKDFREAERKVQEAEAAVSDADSELARLVRQCAHLERVKRVAAALDRRTHLRDALNELARVALLPETADKQVRDATKEITLAEGACVRIVGELEKAIERRDTAVADETLLALADDIRASTHRWHALTGHAEGIAKRRAEVQQLTIQAADLAARLGWPAGTLADWRGRIPSELEREDLSRLLGRYVGLATAIASTAEALAEKRNERSRIALERDPSRDKGAPGSLRDVLAVARKLGDADFRKRALAEPVEAAEKKMSVAFSQLAPWPGDVDALRRIVPPADEELDAIAERVRRIAKDQEKVRSDRDAEARTLELRRLQERQVERDARPVTAEDLAGARGQRDENWRLLRSSVEAGVTSNTPPSAERLEEFEALVLEVDLLADRRFDAAEASVSLQQVRADIETCACRLQAADTRLTELASEAETALNELAQLQAGFGISIETPAKLRAWIVRREKALDEALVLERARGEVERHDRDVEAAAQGLREALTAAGVAMGDVERRGFAGLVGLADETIRARDDERTRQQALSKQLKSLDQTLPDLEVKHGDAERAMIEWQEHLAKRLAEFDLPHATEPEVPSRALSLMHDLDGRLREISSIEKTRIETMLRDLEMFGHEIARLVCAGAPDLQGQEPMDAARELERRLVSAEDSKNARDAAIKQIGVLEEAHRKECTKKKDAESRLQPLFERSGVASASDLAEAIELSQRRRQRQRDLDTTEQHLVETGDGLTLDELVVESASEDRALLDVALTKARQEYQDQAEKQKGLVVSLKDAQRELAAIAGQADAATAASQRNEAIASMTETMERYIRVRVALVLLRWAIERFRREKQGPLLARASGLFSILTLGEFVQLVAEFDEKDEPRLAGIRRNAKSVAVGGMSTGTADQLYLALRIAALEMHLESSLALPFIADDLLAHFDNQRAAAALRVLSDLSTHTQVLFFTHHEHLVDIAQQALGNDVHVVRLQ
jgi:uncharacterized protein YhaN